MRPKRYGGQRTFSVSAETGENVARLAFTGRYAEVEVNASLYKDGAFLQSLIPAVDVNTPMQPLVYRYRFTGGVCGGTWTFIDEASPITSQEPIPWVNDAEITATDILAAIVELGGDYAGMLEESDIEITNEAVGNKFIIRELQITFPSYPSPPYSGTDGCRCWLGIDTSNLLVAEPMITVESLGGIAQNEVQLVSLENKPTSGNWKLSYNGTESSNIAYNASASTVQTQIASISGASCTVIGANGGPYLVKWAAKATRFLLVGIPGTLAVSLSPSFDVVVVTQGTGPNFYDNDDNWSLGHVPEDGETIVLFRWLRGLFLRTERWYSKEY